MKSFKQFLEDSSSDERAIIRKNNTDSARSELNAREKTSHSFEKNSKMKAQNKRQEYQDAVRAVKEKYKRIYPNLKKEINYD